MTGSSIDFYPAGRDILALSSFAWTGAANLTAAPAYGAVMRDDLLRRLDEADEQRRRAKSCGA